MVVDDPPGVAMANVTTTASANKPKRVMSIPSVRRPSFARLLVRRKSKQGITAIPVEWIDGADEDEKDEEDDEVEDENTATDGEEDEMVFVSSRYSTPAAVPTPEATPA